MQENQKLDSDLVVFFRISKAQGLTPDQALYQYLKMIGQGSLIPEPFRSLGSSRIQPIRDLLVYLASTEGSSWLRRNNNLENLLQYLASVL